MSLWMESIIVSVDSSNLCGDIVAIDFGGVGGLMECRMSKNL